MKKILSVLIFVFSVITLTAQTVTIPADSLLGKYNEFDSYIATYASNQIKLGCWTNPIKSGSNYIYTINTSKWTPSKSDLDSIISNEGEVNNFLMVLKIPIGIVASTPAALADFPDREIYDDGSVLRPVNYWFSQGYANANESYIYFFTQTHKETRLTATQILTILGLSSNVELLNTTDEEFTDVQAD